MSTLYKRLAALEARRDDAQPEHHVFIAIVDTEPMGFEAEGVQVLRQPGESTDNLQHRCAREHPRIMFWRQIAPP